MTTEEYIKDCAARGYSKTMVLETLGICRYSFYAMLEAMPPIEWPARGQSLNCKLANEARRGISTAKLKAASEKALAARRELRSHTVDGSWNDRRAGSQARRERYNRAAQNQRWHDP